MVQISTEQNKSSMFRTAKKKYISDPKKKKLSSVGGREFRNSNTSESLCLGFLWSSSWSAGRSRASQSSHSRLAGCRHFLFSRWLSRTFCTVYICRRESMRLKLPHGTWILCIVLYCNTWLYRYFTTNDRQLRKWKNAFGVCHFTFFLCLCFTGICHTCLICFSLPGRLLKEKKQP